MPKAAKIALGRYGSTLGNSNHIYFSNSSLIYSLKIPIAVDDFEDEMYIDRWSVEHFPDCDEVEMIIDSRFALKRVMANVAWTVGIWKNTCLAPSVLIHFPKPIARVN